MKEQERKSRSPAGMTDRKRKQIACGNDRKKSESRSPAGMTDRKRKQIACGNDR
jgi:hypothetical protein